MEGDVGFQGESTLSEDEKKTEARRHVEHLTHYLDLMEDERERKFVSDMAERFENYGDKTFVSNKQLFWLRDLATKY